MRLPPKSWIDSRYSSNSLRALAASLRNSPKKISFAEGQRTISSGIDAYQVVEERLVYLFKRCKDLKSVKMVHAHLMKTGFHRNVYVVSNIILCCADVSSWSWSESMDYALSVFNQMENPDVFTWNTMIRGLGRTEDPIGAVLIYQRMQAAALSPDNFTYSFLLKICAGLPSIALGEQVHAACVRHGVESHEFVSNTLVHMYAMCRRMKDARKVFDKMLQENVVAWNTLVNGYVHTDQPQEAFTLFHTMRQRDMVPDEITLVVLLSAGANAGELDLGRYVHSVVVLLGHAESIQIQNSLIHTYAKCGEIGDARQVFDFMHTRNQVSWNVMMQGLAFHGRAAEALEVFAQMEREMDIWEPPPDDVTFLAILSACSHAGLVNEGKKHLRVMIRKYGLQPSVKHYGCIVDLLGRSGLLDEAYEFVQGMPTEYKNAIIWRTLLGACRVHGRVELAELIRTRLLDLEPDHSGDYVLMSHVYATEERWRDAVMVREDMQKRGVLKPEAANSTVDSSPPNIERCIRSSNARGQLFFAFVSRE